MNNRPAGAESGALSQPEALRPPEASQPEALGEARRLDDPLRACQAELERCKEELHRAQAQRDDARGRYAMHLGEMRDAFAVQEILFDPAGQAVDCRFLAVNPAFEALMGLNASHLVGRAVSEVLPATGRHWLETCGQVAQTGQTVVFESHSADLAKDFRVTAFRPAPGQVACILADITERRRDQEDLLREQRLMTTLLSSLPGIFYLYSYPALRLVRWNTNHETLLGFGPGEIGGRHILEWHKPEAKLAVLGAVEAVMERGVETLESPLLAKDGRAVPFLMTGRRVELFGEAYLMGVGIDITERKQAEEALRRIESRQAKMAANIGDVIVIIDQDGINRYKSPNIEKQFGWRPEDVVGLGALDNVHPDDLELARQFVGGLMSQPGASGTTSCRYRCKDGAYKWIEFTGLNLLHDPDIRGLLGNYHDITERKQAEEALRQSLGEKEMLLKEIHHRVKNNLQIISSLLGLQTRKITSPVAHAALLDMRNRVRSMGLIHEHLYRSETLAAVDLSAYLKRLCEQLFHALAASPGSIELRLDLAPVRLPIDQAIPCGLLVNELVSNALKHAFPDGRAGQVRVELQPLAGVPGVCLRVADNGAGLPPDFNLSRVTSLGLQLVSSLTRQLGGRLAIHRTEGTLFEVVLGADDPAKPIP